MISFNLGQEYPRAALLDFVGSKQQQAGVLWGIREPGCLIITSGGRHGRKVGYSDGRLPDGCWWYFGQGRSGDHSLDNPANARLAAAVQSVLLFTTREPTASEVRERGNYKKAFTFKGEFNVGGQEEIFEEEGIRVGDRLLRFLLIPCDPGLVIPPIASETTPIGLIALRIALLARRGGKTKVNVTPVEYRARCLLVKGYALLRARSKCEGCGSGAPFVDENGQGFLEVHHILRLADDGDDAPHNVAAVCPNCHRRAHYSADRGLFRTILLAAVRAAEDLLEEEGRSES